MKNKLVRNNLYVLTRLIFFFILSFFFNSAHAQLTFKKDYTEVLSYNTASGGTVYNFQPALKIQAFVKNPPCSQQSIDWLITPYFHNYKKIKFTKTYILTCGKTISIKAEIDDVKNGIQRYGTTFSGDLDLNDLTTISKALHSSIKFLILSLGTCFG